MDTSEQMDLRVVQLLCSRLCHDLAGPAGAVHNGMELIQESDDDDHGGALGLVATSIEQLNARLGFYRLAFGLGGVSGRKPALLEARDLAAGFLKGGRITLAWSETSGQENVDRLDQKRCVGAIKLLLNMILFGVATLPRGGVLEVGFVVTSDDPAAVGLTVRASGQGAVIKEDMMAVLDQKIVARDENDKMASFEAVLSAQNVQGVFMQRLAKGLGGLIEVSGETGQVQIAALLQD